jgi:hypothetical protein
MKRIPRQRRSAAKALGHQGCCDPADKDLICLPIGYLQREVNRLGDARILKGEQGRDVNSVPCCAQYGLVLAFDEADMVFLAVGTVVLGKLHETEWRILILVAGLDEENFPIRHVRRP